MRASVAGLLAQRAGMVGVDLEAGQAGILRIGSPLVAPVVHAHAVTEVRSPCRPRRALPSMPRPRHTRAVRVAWRGLQGQPWPCVAALCVAPRRFLALAEALQRPA